MKAKKARKDVSESEKDSEEDDDDTGDDEEEDTDEDSEEEESGEEGKSVRGNLHYRDKLMLTMLVSSRGVRFHGF